jgi:hypothetical protein
MNRRKFLGIVGMGISSHCISPKLASAFPARRTEPAADLDAAKAKPYGSGHFGEWITDQFGLPGYRYACDQITDPLAVSPVHREWRSETDHTHQVGNNRLVAAVSNYGYVQVRQDEGSPKFLNDYSPEDAHYGAGIGFLTDGDAVISTYYPGNGASWERILGEGYLRKTVKAKQYEVDQIILAPYGDDPVLVSKVTLTNHGTQPAHLRWVEYWGAQNYQFSYRAGMEAKALQDTTKAAALRRAFGDRFAHHFEAMPNGRGLTESQTFLGRTDLDKQIWQELELAMKDPSGPWGGHIDEPAPEASMEDLHPPSTFLASLDARIDGYATDASKFFGTGGIDHPSGLSERLANDAGTTGPASAFLLERHVQLQAGEKRTLYFLYGYVPEGFGAEELVKKYSADPGEIMARSCAAWKAEGIRFRTPSDPWVEREISWHNYYLRSSMTYDSYFREHILSQGHVYQYIMGFQGAARDPLQHTMPFIFSDPKTVREIIRYTLKEIQPDGSIPYALVGSGVPMPSAMDPGDQEMWLLWTTAEYVLATRDKKFLDEKVVPYPHQTAGPSDPTVRERLGHAYSHLVNVIGVGKHGLMRLAKGDWNDGVVIGRVADKYMDEVRTQGESVLNAAMACYVLDYYAQMLAYVGDVAKAAEARAKAGDQRMAVRENWTGRWFRRAWLGPSLGWTGDDRVWLEPQPWAIIGGAATPEQRETLVATLDELLRKPSPIGAMIMNKGEDLPSKRPGILENGGIWPSINGTLIWALAASGGGSAWDEWKKNSLAMHAHAYPEIWYGIWSGPDTYNSVLSKYPGQTQRAEPTVVGKKSPSDWGINWTDFPVMNMHPHAWPLYSAAKLLGLEFNEAGLTLNPALPLAEYEFSSPLLGFRKSAGGFSGWYAPAAPGRWEIEIVLSSEDLEKKSRVKVNGVAASLADNGQPVRFSGESKPGAPLHWEIA